MRLLPLWEQSLSPYIQDEIGTEEHDDKRDSCKQDDERKVAVIGFGGIAS